MKSIFGRFITTLVCVLCGSSIVRAETAASIQIDTNFPGGNIIVEQIQGSSVSVRTDLRDTKGWWFYWCFRVRGAAGKTLTFNFTERDPIGARGPGVSLDEGATWSWLGKPANYKSFTYSFPPDANSVRFSFGMPYTETHLKTFLQSIGNNSALKLETLCHSRKGRAVEQLRIGKLKGDPKFRVMVTCRAHCCEMMTSYVAEGLIKSALADEESGKWFRENVELLVIPFVDKDGVEDGDQGKLRKPRDHNRDYDANAIYRETRAIQKFVPKWSAGKLRLMIDLHCPYIRGGAHETIHLVGSPKPEIWREQEQFGKILERVQTGTLVYRSANNLPYGKSWNSAKNFTAGPSIAGWAGELPGVKLATTIEFPYANVLGNEVNAETARAFGSDLARAIRAYLGTVK